MAARLLRRRDALSPGNIARVFDRWACDRSAFFPDPSLSRNPPLNSGRPDVSAAILGPFGSAKVRIYNNSSTYFSISRPLPTKLAFSRFYAKAPTESIPTNKAVETDALPQDVIAPVPSRVISFSPLEGAAVKLRDSALRGESLKVKRTELSLKITYALIPALLLVSKSPATTSAIVLAVFWQIYGFHKEIFLDYIHHEVTRKWVLIYFKLLLIILAKDLLLLFNLG